MTCTAGESQWPWQECRLIRNREVCDRTSALTASQFVVATRTLDTKRYKLVSAKRF